VTRDTAEAGPLTGSLGLPKRARQNVARNVGHGCKATGSGHSWRRPLGLGSARKHAFPRAPANWRKGRIAGHRGRLGKGGSARRSCHSIGSAKQLSPPEAGLDRAHSRTSGASVHWPLRIAIARSKHLQRARVVSRTAGGGLLAPFRRLAAAPNPSATAAKTAPTASLSFSSVATCGSASRRAQSFLVGKNIEPRPALTRLSDRVDRRVNLGEVLAVVLFRYSCIVGSLRCPKGSLPKPE
jgi:hypothetical protein